MLEISLASRAAAHAPDVAAAPAPAAIADGTPTPPAPPPVPRTTRRRRAAEPAPGARIGAWKIERELGRGGMATVYAVVHTRFGKRAALKLAHRGILGPQFTAETFLREARVANRIDHAGVTDVFGTGSYDGRPYLAMERLRGRSLGALLDDGGVPRDTALDVLLELCEVLEAAHAAGVVHGDLKVDNVFVLDQPIAGGRRIKLVDWGIARIAGEDDPLRGLIAGTLTYVAPEVIRGEDIGPASDVYALGVLGYRLLLGAPPFAAASDLELLQQHLHEPPPGPRTRWPGIPGELEATLIAMLAKQPAARPSLCDIAAALRSARRRFRPAWRAGVRRRSAPVASVPAPGAAVAAMPIADVIGRPIVGGALGAASGGVLRAAGAALGLALVVVSLLQLCA